MNEEFIYNLQRSNLKVRLTFLSGLIMGFLFNSLKRITLACLFFFLLIGLIIAIWQFGFYLYNSGYQVETKKSIATPGAVFNQSTIEDLQDSNTSEPDTILLITLDTLRADHLSNYGYFRKTSPFLESFAQEGIQFNRAYASMPTTAPSHATILSSLYPFQHRLLKNSKKMRGDVLTLSEILNKQGYKTGAVVSTNRHFKNSRVAQGFQYYNGPTLDDLLIKRNKEDTRYIKYRPADRTYEEAKMWLEREEEEEKVFLWTHFFDPHRPYHPKNKMMKQMVFDDKNKAKDWSEFLRQNHKLNISESIKNIGSNKKLRQHQLYDSEILMTDHYVDKVISSINKFRGNDLLVIIVADHGEGMGNHNYWAHGREIYNEQVRVPLIIQFPDNRYENRQIDEIVETNDIMPTVLREIGIDTNALQKRQFPIEGTPLQELLEGNDKPFKFAFHQRRLYEGVPWETKKLFPMAKVADKLLPSTDIKINFEPGNKYGLTTKRFKYIHQTSERDEFYNMKKDFYEQNNLIHEDSSEARGMASTLNEVVQSLKRKSPTGTESVGPEIQEKLEALGYVN